MSVCWVAIKHLYVWVCVCVFARVCVCVLACWHSLYPLPQLVGVLRFCGVARAAGSPDWNGKWPGAFSCAVQTWSARTHTHTRRGGVSVSKRGGEIEKRAFKLSPLAPVSVIADGVVSMQPTVLVSTASPPRLVNTDTFTHTHTHRLI